MGVKRGEGEREEKARREGREGREGKRGEGGRREDGEKQRGGGEGRGRVDGGLDVVNMVKMWFQIGNSRSLIRVMVWRENPLVCP